MSKKEHLVCHGAQCTCKFGDFPDILEVSSQQKHYINDTNGAQKLIATNMEIGQPFTVNTFGQCKLQPTGSSFKPCQPMITGWQGFYDKVQIVANNGYPLLEGSKATCAIAGAPCVEIMFHGQIPAPEPSNFKETPAQQAVAQQMNPVPTAPIMEQNQQFQFSTEASSTAEEKESEYALESTYVHEYFKNVASAIISEFKEDEKTSTVYDLYKEIIEGGITNPSIIVTKTPVSNQLASYDKSNGQISIWENSLISIKNDIDKKLKLAYALTKAYAEYISSKVKTKLRNENEFETHQCNLFSFNISNQEDLIIGKLKSPEFTGNLTLDFSKNKLNQESRWDVASSENMPSEMMLFDDRHFNVYESYANDSVSFLFKFEYDLDAGFSANFHVNDSVLTNNENWQKIIKSTFNYFSKDSDSEIAYTYYVGGDHFDGFGFLGHTSVGYSGSKDKNNTTLYAPLSGNSNYREDRISEDDEIYSGVSEANTIKSYLDSGEIVERYHYNLPDSVMTYFALILEGELNNPGSIKGAWCTHQAYDAYYSSYIEAGYDDEASEFNAKKIINHTTPQELSRKQILNSGSKKYDKFYKKGDKYYQEINTFNIRLIGSWSKSIIEIKF